MKIETKFEIEQEVFYMEDNKIKKEKIWKMCVEINSSNKYTFCYFYRVGNNADPYCLRDTYVFTTKEELIDSL